MRVLTFCSIYKVRLLSFVLSYVNITELLKFKMNAKRPFWNRLLPEVNQADIAVYICQIKRPAGNFFLKRANEYCIVSGPSNQRVHYMGIKMSPKISRCYVMAMSSMRKQKLIDQSSCKIFEIMRKTIKNGRHDWHDFPKKITSYFLCKALAHHEAVNWIHSIKIDARVYPGKECRINRSLKVG